MSLAERMPGATRAKRAWTCCVPISACGSATPINCSWAGVAGDHHAAALARARGGAGLMSVMLRMTDARLAIGPARRSLRSAKTRTRPQPLPGCFFLWCVVRADAPPSGHAMPDRGTGSMAKRHRARADHRRRSTHRRHRSAPWFAVTPNWQQAPGSASADSRPAASSARRRAVRSRPSPRPARRPANRAAACHRPS